MDPPSLPACVVRRGLRLPLTPLPAAAQRSGARVAFFRPAPPSPELRLSLDAFKHGLREQGYEEGRNVTVELTVLTNKEERVSDLAADIVRRKPDIVFAIASTGVDAVRKVGPATPIVALDLETDPVVSGIAASLARPGGSVTGIFLDLPGLAGKWLELLKEVSPLTTRVAILWDTATGRVPLAAAEGSARALRVQLQLIPVRDGTDLDGAFRSAANARAGAVVILSSPVLNAHRRDLVELCAKYRLPAIMPFPLFAEDGGLMAYGPDLVELYRQSGMIVGKALKAGKVAEIPIERPSRFVLAINTKTAKALGLVFPHSRLIQADRVIE